MGKHLFKQLRQHGRLDARAVIQYAELRQIALPPNPKLDFRRAFRMEHGVFHQVNQHLFDQRRIHRHHQQLVRHADANRQRVEPLFEFAHGLRGDFLRGLRHLVNLHRALVEPRDGQHVFHQPHQPLRVVANVADQILFHLVAELVVVFQHGGGRADDRGQRCAQIVRHGAKQVRLHLFLLRFGFHALLPLHLIGQHADDD